MSAISTGCSRRDDALRWCEQRLKDSHPKRRSLTLREYAEGFWDPQGKYAQSRQVRGYSISAGTLYVAKLATKKHLLAEWGSATLSEIASGKLDAWIVALKKNGVLASSTINHILHVTRTILAQAVADGILDANPARLVRPVKLEQAQRGIFDMDEVRKLLLDPCPWHDHRHYTINLLVPITRRRSGDSFLLSLDVA
jgi:hypothetical protein